MNGKLQKRIEKLMPNEVPKYIRCYDNGGESIDRYTVVFIGRYRHKFGGEGMYLAMNESPFHPQGFGQHGFFKDESPDVNKWGFAPMVHKKCGLGTRIRFSDLPKDCQTLVLQDYKQMWDLNNVVIEWDYDEFGYEIQIIKEGQIIEEFHGSDNRFDTHQASTTPESKMTPRAIKAAAQSMAKSVANDYGTIIVGRNTDIGADRKEEREGLE